MGCSSSKRVKATNDDVYRPAPSSFAVFDINAIEEPWLNKVDSAREEEEKEKPTHVPPPLLDKLSKLEFAGNGPHSWVEFRKALEDLKPAINNNNNINNNKIPAATLAPKQAPKKTTSFHTIEELDAKLSSPKPKSNPNPTRTESTRTTQVKKPESVNEAAATTVDSCGVNIKPVKENIFIVRDRLEREREGKLQLSTKSMKRDPLSDFPEKCPPGGGHSLVVYTTSLRGVRRTYEECNKVRGLMELHGVVFDERDVSLHGEFLTELKELLGRDQEASVPRVFVKGRYLGGVEEVSELNESGKLGTLLSLARVERGLGRQGCEGCGGARFVPCLDCGGSCKVFNGDKKERCDKCNENGLVHCPACIV